MVLLAAESVIWGSEEHPWTCGCGRHGQEGVWGQLVKSRGGGVRADLSGLSRVGN